MALGELLAALEREAATEVETLRSRAAAEAARLRAAAGEEAVRRREQALVALREELAAAEDLALATARRERRERELGGRQAVLARLRAATLAAAEAAEGILPLPALQRLVHAARAYLPPGAAGILRCPPALLQSAREVAAVEAGEGLLVVPAAAGEPLALLAGGAPLLVECGLVALVERRWPGLAIALLAKLDSSPRGTNAEEQCRAGVGPPPPRRRLG